MPPVRFKRCGGSKQAVLREKLAHKAEDNIGLSETTQNDYLQKTHHNWTKTNKLQRPCFKQDTKANQRWLKAMWALCTLWLLLKK